MSNTYYVSKWIGYRKNEMIPLPETFDVHSDYLLMFSKDEVISTFKGIWNLWQSIYDSMRDDPESYGLPLCDADTKYCDQVARESRSAMHRIFLLIHSLAVSGRISDRNLVVDAETLKTNLKANKVVNPHMLFDRLETFGIFTDGLKNHRIPARAEELIVSCPDNPKVLTILKFMADKAYISNRPMDFVNCHYKLFKDDLDTADFGTDLECITDRIRERDDLECALALDGLAREAGLFGYLGWGGVTGRGGETDAYYYCTKRNDVGKKSVWQLQLMYAEFSLRLLFRIRNIAGCVDYLKTCPDYIKELFLKGDSGCGVRYNGCTKGQEYAIDGTTYWHCGCYGPHISVEPRAEDIPHYLELIRLGGFRAKG